MTREGVMGLEYLKWSARVTPVYNCTLPFTRMLAGPMDYTPGGFLNVTREAFVPRSRQPMVMGTRRTSSRSSWCSRATSRWSPTIRSGTAEKEKRTSPSSAPCPRAGRDARAERPADGVHRHRPALGEDWFLGCLTDWDPRDLELPLDFLRDGRSVAEIMPMRPTPGTPHHTVIEKKDVSPTTKLKLHLAPGGGAAVRSVPRLRTLVLRATPSLADRVPLPRRPAGDGPGRFLLRGSGARSTSFRRSVTSRRAPSRATRPGKSVRL